MTGILACDPGKTSGFCLVLDGKIVESGTIRIDSGKGLERAQGVVNSMPPDSIAVIEGAGYLDGKSRYDTVWGLGCRAGMWKCLARLRGMTVEILHPDLWQRAQLHMGKRNPGREMLKWLSVAKAKKITGRTVGEDEADAICIADYWLRK